MALAEPLSWQQLEEQIGADDSPFKFKVTLS